MYPFTRSRSLTVAVAVVSISVFAAPAVAATASPLQVPAPTSDVTSPLEAQRVDRIQATPHWEPCGYNPNQECAYLDVPMDYDNPTGPTMKIGAQRNKTSKPGHKKGDLWVVDRSLSATRPTVEFPEEFLSADILDNFDIIGIQPRGTFKVEYSGVQCFNDQKEQLTALQRLYMTHPAVTADEDSYLRFSKLAAERCSTKGMPIAAHLSVAQQARDLEVMRRLFSKEKMTMISTLEGGQLAQTYAAMFPDRLRAVYVNDAVDPVKYNGGVGQHALRSVRTGEDMAAKKGHGPLLHLV